MPFLSRGVARVWGIIFLQPWIGYVSVPVNGSKPAETARIVADRIGRRRKPTSEMLIGMNIYNNAVQL